MRQDPLDFEFGIVTKILMATREGDAVDAGSSRFERSPSRHGTDASGELLNGAIGLELTTTDLETIQAFSLDDH